MPSIIAIHQRPATGFIAGIQYKSGRRIYCGHDPAAGTFVSHPENAQVFPTREAAEAALQQLLDAFEVVHSPALTLFIDPS